MALLLVSACGSGGGGSQVIIEPPVETITGKLVLQRSLASLPAPSSVSGESGRDLDVEPNNQLFSAGDLGRELAAGRYLGRLSVPSDLVDVFRAGPFGPMPSGAGRMRLRVGFSCAATSLRLELGRGLSGLVPTAISRLRSGQTVDFDVQQGTELVLRIYGSETASYAIAVSPVSDAQAAVPGAALASGVAKSLSVAEAHESFANVLGDPSFETVPGEVLLEGSGGAAAKAALESLGLQFVSQGGDVQKWRSRDPRLFAKTAEARIAEADLLREVRRTVPGLRYASPESMTPLSALASLQSAGGPNDKLYASNQWNLRMVDMEGAWTTTKGDPKVTIALMDTGVMHQHPDLKGRYSALSYDFISDPKNGGDGDGVDANPEEPKTNEAITLFHGTYVSGVAAASTNNLEGIAGATWNGKFMMLRVFGPLGGSSLDRIQAWRYIAGLSNASGRILKPSERPSVLNLSYATKTVTAAERAAILEVHKAGILMVAAMGNESLDLKTPRYPAAWPEVIAVAALGPDGLHAPYSNQADFVDVAAPGGTEIAGPKGVTSTWAATVNSQFIYTYNSFLGTSVATPLVAGTIALMKAVDPSIDYATVRRIFAQTAVDIGPKGKDRLYGYGMLNARSAVKLASAPPILHLEPGNGQYSFKDTEKSVVFDVTNVGGRRIDALGISFLSGGSGALQASIDSKSTPTKLRVTLQRSGLRAGKYQEELILKGNGAQSTLRLNFSQPIPAPKGKLMVRLLSGVEIIRQVEAAPDGSFRFGAVGYGPYFIEAGIDRNQNGIFGESQEWYVKRALKVDASPRPFLNPLIVPWVN